MKRASHDIRKPQDRQDGVRRYPGRMVLVGTAGWSIPRAAADRFPGSGSHLERYARVLPVAEINSCFHRPHSAETYAKWASATPPRFRFAVKLTRAITHEGELRRARAPLERFLEETAGLGAKRGPVLVQLPPSLAFERRVAATFFDRLRAQYAGDVVCEPRHQSWFTASAEALLVRFRVARVAADPALAEGADAPGGWDGLAYYRLHGSPRKYWSRYTRADIERLAQVTACVPGAWCIFDNTASGAAIENALDLLVRSSQNRLQTPADVTS
jgi:uncharacterized protein YecE (DUF72 family)